MSRRFMSYDDIINLAACPTCCAFRREPCTFARVEDPSGVRRSRRQSHDARVILSRKHFEASAPIPVDIPGFRL